VKSRQSGYQTAAWANLLKSFGPYVKTWGYPVRDVVCSDRYTMKWRDNWRYYLGFCTVKWLNVLTFRKNVLPPSSGWIQLAWKCNQPQWRLQNLCIAKFKKYSIANRQQNCCVHSWTYRLAAHRLLFVVPGIDSCMNHTYQWNVLKAEHYHLNDIRPSEQCKRQPTKQRVRLKQEKKCYTGWFLLRVLWLCVKLCACLYCVLNCVRVHIVC
jgi:hypothetical protein